MGKKLIFSLIVCFVFLISIGLVTAQPPTTTNIQAFDTGFVIEPSPTIYIKQNTDYVVNFFVYNISNGVPIDNTTTSCVFYMADNQGNLIHFSDVLYTTYWTTTIAGGNFSELGHYPYGIKCNSSELGGAFINYFEVTYTGKIMSVSQSILSIGFLSLLVLIFFLNFIAMGYLPKRNQVDEEGKILSITYLKYFRNILAMTGYFLFIGIVYIASNLAYAFLDEVLIADTLFMIFRVAFGFAPVVVIVWLIWIFVSMFHDKQFQNMLNRGMFPQGTI